MYLYIGLALIFGILFSELKDFFTNGGFSNTLAFTLFKLLITVLIIFAVGFVLYLNTYFQNLLLQLKIVQFEKKFPSTSKSPRGRSTKRGTHIVKRQYSQ